MCHIGSRIVGDMTYGEEDRGEKEKRLCLHAAFLHNAAIGEDLIAKDCDFI